MCGVIDALVIVCLLLLASASSSTDQEHKQLQAVLANVVAQEQAALSPDPLHPPWVAAVVVDVDNGAAASVDGDEFVYLASGVKLFVLMELYRQHHNKSLRFDEEIPFTTDDVRDGSPTMNREPINARYTVRQLIKWMIRDSDNAAFDLLLRRAGAKNVEALAHRFGPMGPILSTLETRRAVYAHLDPRARELTPLQIRDVRWRDGWHPRLDLLKKHLGKPAGKFDLDDYDAAWAAHYATRASSAPLSTTAQALTALAKGEVVSPADDAEMRLLLSDVATSDRRIVGDLPKDALVAHKTGSLHKRLCDLGIVSLKDGSFVVVAVAVRGADVARAEAAAARVARAAFDVVVDARGVVAPNPEPAR